MLYGISIMRDLDEKLKGLRRTFRLTPPYRLEYVQG
jgi:hypothetical protein